MYVSNTPGAPGEGDVFPQKCHYSLRFVLHITFESKFLSSLTNCEIRV